MLKFCAAYNHLFTKKSATYRLIQWEIENKYVHQSKPGNRWQTYNKNLSLPIKHQ